VPCAVLGPALAASVALSALACNAKSARSAGEAQPPVPAAAAPPAPPAIHAGTPAGAAPGDAAPADAAIAPAAIDAGPASTLLGEGLAASSPREPGDASAPPAGMLAVPGGVFVMGTDRGGEEDERPAHEVRLAAFWLDATEVTHAAYAACVAAKACRRADPDVALHGHAAPEALFHHPRQPVCGVSWDDARAYCAWRGARLPREAEFERAVRGDDGRRYPWGRAAPAPELTAFGRALESGATDDVGSHPLGRGPYGHDDLAGNVWEWMEDEYDPIAYRRATAAGGVPGTCAQIEASLAELRAAGKQGFTGSNPLPTTCEHVLRGGAYNYDGPGLRSTNRVHHPGAFRIVMAGFRCAMDAR